MGNRSSASGSYTYYAGQGGSNFTFSDDTDKYIDTYAYGISKTDQTAYNRARLGDATGEIVKSSGYGWNGDYAYFNNYVNSWFRRGDSYSGSSIAGMFSYDEGNGIRYSDKTARAALVPAP